MTMCPHHFHIRVLLFSLSVMATISFVTGAQAKGKVFIPGQRAVVVDERLSALRTRPDVKAVIKQRLHRGRAVGILGAFANKTGPAFFRVAVSRNTRGWVLAEAITRTGSRSDAERLMKLIEESEDDFTKARLARICVDEFRQGGYAPKALAILAAAAEKAAERLTRDARRRIGDGKLGAGVRKRDYYLNDVSLDRYNRIGITFDYDENTERIVYDGGAYRELLRRFPKSDEAKLAQERVVRK